MNLVLSAVGKKGLQNQWLHGDYDVVLFHYEEQGKNFKEGRVTHIFKEGFKFPLIKEYLEKCKKEYDYYFFLDDDMLIDSDQIESLFKQAKEINLNIFSPSINPVNQQHNCMDKDEQVLYKFVNWMEIQAVGMEKSIMKRLLHTFDTNKSGWGLPEVWIKEIKSRYLFAIIDNIEILHTKAPKDGEGIYSKISMESAKDELRNIVDVNTNFKVLQKIFKTPLLSTITIYCEKDTELLDEQQSTVPDWAEIVWLKTIPLPENEFIENEVKNITSTGGMIHAEYYYKETEFSFADATNKAIGLSSGYWVLKLDADERLLVHQMKNLYNILDKSRNTDIEGFYLWNCGCYGNLDKAHMAPMIRLHKREYKYSGFAHEHTNINPEKCKYTDFKIDHIGYKISDEEMKEKMIRNIRGMIKSPEMLLSNEGYFNLLARDSYTYYTIKEGIK